jgi:hypothetical protein
MRARVHAGGMGIRTGPGQGASVRWCSVGRRRLPKLRGLSCRHQLFGRVAMPVNEPTAGWGGGACMEPSRPATAMPLPLRTAGVQLVAAQLLCPAARFSRHRPVGRLQQPRRGQQALAAAFEEHKQRRSGHGQQLPPRRGILGAWAAAPAAVEGLGQRRRAEVERHHDYRRPGYRIGHESGKVRVHLGSHLAQPGRGGGQGLARRRGRTARQDQLQPCHICCSCKPMQQCP